MKNSVDSAALCARIEAIIVNHINEVHRASVEVIERAFFYLDDAAPTLHHELAQGDALTQTTTQDILEHQANAGRPSKRIRAERGEANQAETAGNQGWRPGNEQRTQLRALNFTSAQLSQPTPSYAVLKTYQAMLDHTPELLSQTFTHADVVKVLSHDGGAQALAALVLHAHALIGLELGMQRHL